jgi:glycerate kinase
MAAVIPDTVLIVAEDFPGLSAERVVGALTRGLQSTERRLPVKTIDESTRDLREGRAVVIAAARLDERTLAGSLAFEVATAARQSGVPAYAVAAQSALDLFDARMLDLQMVLQARTAQSLRAAGRKLAEAI